MILCDTNIFIHAFNGNEETIESLKRVGIENIVLSSITVMELYQGMGNKKELEIMKKRIKYYDVIEIDERVSNLAKELIEKYALSLGLKIPDSIIGATAIIHEVEIYTYNLKDFHYLPNIKLYTNQE
ncbi:MAG: type II toxin-antitoxin system VapC family toxin [Saprospiraceae bacterium]